MIQRLNPRRAAQLLLVMLFMLGACGTSSRTKALRVNLIALNTARDATLAISKEREKQLYDACLAEARKDPPTCTKEEGHARVDAWQATVDVVTKAIDLGYRAIHDAALLDDNKSALTASTAAAKALAIYKKLKELP